MWTCLTRGCKRDTSRSRPGLCYRRCFCHTLVLTKATYDNRNQRSAISMTPSPTLLDAPISKLNRDLLWNIFRVISDINFSKYDRVPDGARRHSSLTTLHICSQVCTYWRNLILDSSFLWGNYIDLDFLTQDRGKWRNEVLQRTGDALLSVYSANKIIKLHTKGHAFLMYLIQYHWARVQLFDVH